jgi:hypothetical protein
VPAIRFRTLNRSYFAEVAFAPSLHCDVVEEFKIVFGRGREKYYSHFKVTKYIPVEPPPTVFTPPSTYRFDRAP